MFSLPICDIMGLTKSLSLWERWRRSRRRGQIVATTTLSPATAGALPEGEPSLAHKPLVARETEIPPVFTGGFLLYICKVNDSNALFLGVFQGIVRAAEILVDVSDEKIGIIHEPLVALGDSRLEMR